MNYGAIGQIIGHETTHGFDDQGRQFDKNGNLIDWWKQETKEKFLSKAQCIIQQYGNYTVEEVGLKVSKQVKISILAIKIKIVFLVKDISLRGTANL